jgi:hypothetical protein
MMHEQVPTTAQAMTGAAHPDAQDSAVGTLFLESNLAFASPLPICYLWKQSE